MGSTVSQVLKSKHPQFSEGEFAVGYDGWQAYGIAKGESLRKLDPKQVPISYALALPGCLE